MAIERFIGFNEFLFHVFARYEIHIQAFGVVFYGKISFPDPHLRKIIFKMYIQIFTKNIETMKHNQQKLVPGTHIFPENFRFL